jgi:putative flippase GtrA
MGDGRPLDYRSFRHWGGFIFSGGSAFLVDAGITTGLIHLAGLGPFVSRLIGIGCAMVFAWLMHRRVTFAIDAPPHFGEFARFAVVSGSANALNYAIYAAILLVWPLTLPLAALVVSTGIATCASYLGFRFGVFRRAEKGPSPPTAP